MKHPVVSRSEWLAARKALLLKEKEETRLRDAVNAARLALPWVKVEKDYVFDTPEGARHLGDLFAGRSQLVMYHFMLGPGWKAGCPSCSFMGDHVDGALVHLNHHDVTWIAVARAPMNEIAAYKTRMGWKFPWVSSFGSSFNHDFGVSFSKEELENGRAEYNYAPITAQHKSEETPGFSAFFKDENGAIYHTYSCYARGLEDMVGAFMILDRAPLGRNEKTIMDFVRRHDEYDRPIKAAE